MQRRGRLNAVLQHLALMSLLSIVGSADAATLEPGGDSTLATLAQDEGWLALGHWRPTLTQGWRSDIEPGAFFLATNGRDSPAAELAATLKVMATGAPVGPNHWPGPCALPARATFLRQRGCPVAAAFCPEYAAFRRKLDVHSATLIFASAYANNPASMFGHVVLRLNHSARPDGQQPKLFTEADATPHLLDNSVAFLAQVGTDDDPLSYAYKGLTGGYPGAYMIDPYYVTVATYTDGESRDLWEYDLNLSEAEVSLLVDHVWEVATLAHFPYFFAHGNCAYQILSIITAARPSAHLMAATGLVVLPLEVARQVHDQLGSTAAVRWRPSLKRQLKTSLDRLSHDQRRRFDALRGDLQGLQAEASPQVVDALIAALNFQKFDSHNHLSAEQRYAFRAALVHRAELGPSDDLSPSEETPVAPDAGHLPAQARLGGGVRQGQGFATLVVKGGLHDFLSDSRGYESFAAIDYLEAALRYYDADRSLQLDHATVVAVNSLAPFDLVSKDWSWRAGIAWQPIEGRAYGGMKSHQLRGELGAGLTWGFFANHLSLFNLALIAADASPGLYHGLRLGPGLALGIVAQWGAYHLLAEWTERRDVIHGDDSRRWSLGQSLSFGRAWELRADWLLTSSRATRTTSGAQHDLQMTLGYAF